ncbi:MAG: 50S ribosomal protein L30 [Steroidobacteraceae bacterium]
MAKNPSAATGKQVKVTLIKSVFGQILAHRETVKGLGLRRIRDSRVLVDTPEVRGMLVAAQHLLQVEYL